MWWVLSMFAEHFTNQGPTRGRVECGTRLRENGARWRVKRETEGKKRRAGEMRMEEIKTTEKQRKKRARAENHRNAKARTMEREDRKRGRQEERGEWLRQPIFFKQLCFHSTGHQGHYPGVNPQSNGAGSLPGQARVAVHQQGGHEQK